MKKIIAIVAAIAIIATVAVYGVILHSSNEGEATITSIGYYDDSFTW